MIEQKIINGTKKNVYVRDIQIGGDKPIYIAGPCSVESREQIMETACELKKVGADIIRGGVFKPRTSPYEFQGLGMEGLKYLKEAGDAVGMPIVTEILSENQLEIANEYVDIIQIGSRNMYNYPLLSAVGSMKKTILLKRGISATIKEWIMAAEYIAAAGNSNIIMCERGIRTYNDHTRNTLDLAAVLVVKEKTGLPVIVDPSHGTGVRDLVIPMSKAALACGADGVIVEVHPNPEKALSDGYQSLNFQEYKELKKVTKLIS